MSERDLFKPQEKHEPDRAISANAFIELDPKADTTLSEDAILRHALADEASTLYLFAQPRQEGVSGSGVRSVKFSAGNLVISNAETLKEVKAQDNNQ
jgi:hypothetical protein